MAQPGTILGQITEEFEKIGKQVVKETTQAPKDIAGKALESLGSSSGPKVQKQVAPVNKAIARAALEELAGRKSQPKQLSVRERLEIEEKQKNEREAKKKEQITKMNLPDTGARRQRGDYFAVKAKQTAAERKYVRQD